MKHLLTRYGAIGALILGAAIYYAWPEPPTWSVFTLERPGTTGQWLASGMQSEAECDDFVRNVLRQVEDPEGIEALRCGYDCRFLNSPPTESYCTILGRLHEPD